MTIPIYQIDTFTNKVFKGNPAAVCPLKDWLPTQQMQQIALENNLSETAFFVSRGSAFEIRWFTPTTEVDLCGHATLATAFVISEYLNFDERPIIFHSKSGLLKVTKTNNEFILDFPSDTIQKMAITTELQAPFNDKILEAYKGKTDVLLLFESHEIIQKMTPQLTLLANIIARGVIVTAKGDDCDFVSRFFGPRCGVDEDPVTGSAHTTLTPYWAEKLNKNRLNAKQLSYRGGNIRCIYKNDRTEIAGQALTYMIGEIFVE